MSGGELPVEPRARDTHPQPEGDRTVGTDRLASVIRRDLVKNGRHERVGPDRQRRSALRWLATATNPHGCLLRLIEPAVDTALAECLLMSIKVPCRTQTAS